MLEAAILYLVIGVVFVAFLALGAGHVEMRAELLGREVPAVYILVSTLLMTLILWPVVLWLLIAGRKAKRVDLANINTGAVQALLREQQAVAHDLETPYQPGGTA